MQNLDLPLIPVRAAPARDDGAAVYLTNRVIPHRGQARPYRTMRSPTLAALQPQYEVKDTPVLNPVIAERARIVKLFTVKYHSLLIRGNT